MENCADKSVDGASDDRINGGDRISAGSEQNHVKSTAIVKYSAIQPAKFAQLQCNTDLNLPPANWLSSSVESYGFQHVLSNSGAFSSFRMAHMFPDCMGEVDVVSDAENVKKLLKIPYSRGSVSMMVHRIENTLLIDEFDIHKHLIRQAESDWVWLRKFFFEHVLQSLGDKDKGVTLRNHSRCALQQKYLTSKFLHYSLAETSGGSHTQKDRENRDAENRPSCSRNEPPLPEPRLEEELPDPATNKTFARNVVWTFEDIQMLLGTDMPIFGGSTHPCISLRLRDMTKPISVLTGIDYWLDNLMCNVPEVMMCYHLDGIVQRYELIKTEDLPHLSGSKFSPKLIRDVAQNILSFLKVNATKAGHTYWLFKSRDDDVVKLYDLTSLCSEGLIDKGQNPFTIPVAMLLYRVARNMKHNLPNSQPGTVRMLLKNCLSLLPKEKYPQIVTSAHYMLSDLYVPVTTDPACPGLSDENSDEEQARQNLEDEYENEETICATTNSVAVQSLANSPTSKVVDPPAPPMVGTIEDRCQMALQHVAAGLECLKYFEETSPKRGTASSKSGEGGNETKHTPKPAEEVKYAHPFQAIPMPYAPISNEKKKGKKSRKGEVVKKEDENGGGDKNAEEMSLRALLCRPQADPLPTWQQPEGVDNAFWNTHLKTLLYEKAFLVYVTLAEQEYNCGNYGVALRYIHCVLRYTCNYFGKNCALISYLLGRAGDCCLLLAKNWPDIDRQFAGYTTKSEIDVEIEEAICKKSSPPLDDNEDCKLMPKVMDNVGQMLVVGCQFYSRALVLAPCDNLRRRLGNIHNEIGSYYMNQAATVQSTPPTNNEERQKYDNLFKAARSHLEQGVDQFESVSDNANLALLHSNTGRLMRLLAHYQQHCHHFDEEEDDDDKIALRVSKGEKYYYNRAFSSYQKALAFLGSRKSNPLIWDTINWELSSALFAYATMMQDYPPPITNRTREEVEREVVDLMQKALKYCDVDTTGPKQPMYQYRAGMLHYRLACLYHKTYRNLVADESNSRRKNVLQLCTMNYEKAARILLTIEHPSDYLRVQLERVALMEFQAENSNGALMKIKHYQYAISILVQCKQILNIMESSVNTQTTNEESDLEEKEKATEKNLLDLMENRLQFLLRTLVKLCITNPQLKLSESEAGYKACYNMLLKRKDGTTLVEHLISVLDSLNGVVAGH